MRARWVVPFLASLLFVAGSVRADEEDDGSFDAEIAASSRFVWRGLAWSRGPVMQPYVGVSRFGLTASVWSNITLTRENEANRVTAVSPEICAAFQLLGIETAVALATFSSPASPRTDEVSLALAKELGPLRLETAHYVDVGAHRGATFGEAAVAIELELEDDTSLTARGTIGWGNGAYDRAWLDLDRASLQLVGGELSLRRTLVGGFDVVVHGRLSTLFAPARVHVAEPTLATFGLTVGVSL